MSVNVDEDDDGGFGIWWHMRIKWGSVGRNGSYGSLPIVAHFALVRLPKKKIRVLIPRFTHMQCVEAI
ncbi:hypothetical protein M8C21_031389 [Ambrosia artemisiifolia]|uniref:Uncharacterized protein n=1 Tax=Ambrosia artemisiifolia TaxID=4212 RepID=A0AAD5BUF7_AMBAR|nr:hypothetical protein M8C21_031389 [Ambrosia artemisiifolia]